MTKAQHRIVYIFEGLKKLALENENDAEIILEELNNMLDDMRDNDFFGTEGQLDPRGDGREED